jgi:hypothetical protein
MEGGRQSFQAVLLIATIADHHLRHSVRVWVSAAQRPHSKQPPRSTPLKMMLEQRCQESVLAIQKMKTVRR